MPNQIYKIKEDEKLLWKCFQIFDLICILYGFIEFIEIKDEFK